MNFGIITDIHSNTLALKQVLNEFEKRKIDKIICCGDIIGIGPYPEETVQMLLRNKDKLIAVIGNHEQYLLNGLPEKVHDDKRQISMSEKENHKWTHSNISEKSKEFIKDIPLYQSIEIENKKIYVVHYPIDENGNYKKHIRKPSIEDNKEMFLGIDADIYIYGHTHIANVNSQNGKIYINPGSLGCPTSSNVANCGILKIEKEKVEYEELKIKYDVNEVIEQIENIKFPHYKKILKIFFGQDVM